MLSLILKSYNTKINIYKLYILSSIFIANFYIIYNSEFIHINSNIDQLCDFYEYLFLLLIYKMFLTYMN